MGSEQRQVPIPDLDLGGTPARLLTDVVADGLGELETEL